MGENFAKWKSCLHCTGCRRCSATTHLPSEFQAKHSRCEDGRAETQVYFQGAYRRRWWRAYAHKRSHFRRRRRWRRSSLLVASNITASAAAAAAFFVAGALCGFECITFSFPEYKTPTSSDAHASQTVCRCKAKAYSVKLIIFCERNSYFLMAATAATATPQHRGGT